MGSAFIVVLQICGIKKKKEVLLQGLSQGSLRNQIFIQKFMQGLLPVFLQEFFQEFCQRFFEKFYRELTLESLYLFLRDSTWYSSKYQGIYPGISLDIVSCTFYLGIPQGILPGVYPRIPLGFLTKISLEIPSVIPPDTFAAIPRHSQYWAHRKGHSNLFFFSILL